MKNIFYHLRSIFPSHSTSLIKDLADTIAITQRSVIQKRLDAISADFDAQKTLAQLQYLQSIDLSCEKTISTNREML